MSKPANKIVKSTKKSKYSKMSHHEHILLLPDTVVGSIEKEEENMFIYNNLTNRMIYKKIEFVPGLYKIYDEIIVNARDQTVRDKTCKLIRVNINRETGEISCMNNGENGIPIEWDEKEKMYNPELIFGVLLTGENFKKTGKTVGGKNGYGAKLANIFSTRFDIEIVDNKNKVIYNQTFSNNMYKKEAPVIKKFKGKKQSYVKLTFLPDYKRFGLEGLTDDIMALFKKRIYDLSACTKSVVKVYFNDELIEINNFKDNVSMYCDLTERETTDSDTEDEKDTKKVQANCVYEEVNDRWKICAVFDSNPKVNQVSYVNGICTFKGGSHVNHVLTQLANKLQEHIIKRKGKKIPIKTQYIKENIVIFIDAVIVDPSFSSQTKEELKTSVTKFGSRCEISDEFVKKFCTKRFMESVLNLASVKGLGELRKDDISRKNTLKNLEKLKDAHQAGKRRRKECRLILTEGDSAKTFAVSGTEVIGNELYGVFPLKGKLLNVREATINQLQNNEEIKNIKKILGLKQGQKYESTDDLRYGGIIILTDSDVDGSHIKGLVINFINHFWPSLTLMDDFIQTMSTPIVKAWKKSDKKKKDLKIFYTLTEFYNWKTKTNMSLWDTKYYKGLGTSTQKEAKECFNDFEKRIISYTWNVSKNENNTLINKKEDIHKNLSRDAIELAFSKQKSDDRKEWLINYDKNAIIDNKSRQISYYNFIHNDLKHFSYYDIIRSIPMIYDGLKPSLRKILFGSILMKIFKRDIKVSQLAGSISEKTEYHHGEASLFSTIIGMAQDFPGSNNINLLMPHGQFGTRLTGGKDHASPRYIYTQLNRLVPLIFRVEDECIYTYVDDDGIKVEPETYAPIIPIVLVNGANGIGTGFSTKIPSFNPLDIIENIRRILKGLESKPMKPWYRGYYGDIVKKNKYTYESKGKYSIKSYNQIEITELPVGVWTEKYVQFLNEKFVPTDPKKPEPDNILKSVRDDSGCMFVKIILTFKSDELKKLKQNGDIYKKLKLKSTLNITNMHLRKYDEEKKYKIVKYDTVQEILKDYIEFRLDMYKKRKAHHILVLKNELDILKYKIKFIEDYRDEIILLRKGKQVIPKQEVLDKLKKLKYPELSTYFYDDISKKNYNYITGMSIFSLTAEELEVLRGKYNEKKEELDIYEQLTIQDLWNRELDELEKEYKKVLQEYEEEYELDKKDGVKSKAKAKAKGRAKAKK